MEKYLIFIILLVNVVFCRSSFSENLDLLSASIDTSDIIEDIKRNSEAYKIESNGSLTVRDFFQEFFSSTNCLPEGVQKELRRKIRDKTIIPEGVASSISEVKDSVVSSVDGRSLLGMLHYYQLIGNDGSITKHVLNGASTYNMFNPYRNMDTQSSYFLYVLDCTGYVSHLAKANLGLSTSSIKAASSLAFDKKQSYIASRALMTNMIASAMSQANVNSSLTPVESLGVLYPLLGVVVSSEGGRIKVPKQVDVISVATNSSSSMQGSVKVESGLSVGFGVGSVSSENQGGFAVSTKISFSAPKSAVLSESIETFLYNAEQVKERLIRAMNKIPIKDTVTTANEIIVKVGLPDNVCKFPAWKATFSLSVNGEQENRIKPVSSAFENGICLLSLMRDAEVQALDTADGDLEIGAFDSIFDSLGPAKPVYKIRL